MNSAKLIRKVMLCFLVSLATHPRYNRSSHDPRKYCACPTWWSIVLTAVLLLYDGIPLVVPTTEVWVGRDGSAGMRVVGPLTMSSGPSSEVTCYRTEGWYGMAWHVSSTSCARVARKLGWVF
jgi:hypothetical protein